MRIILYTGKGGVGKTSIAASTACKIANAGKKVLVISTDQAHSLGDSFDRKLSHSPVEISKNLYAMEIDTLLENEKAWGKIRGYIKELMTIKSQKSIEVEELLVFPGFEELLSLIRIKELAEEGIYDVIVVDCAPTGETMSLLKFPELFKWWMEKIFPMKRKGAKLAKPIVESTIKIPMPSDDTFDEIEQLYKKLEELKCLMSNKDIVSIRIVTTPEKVVIKETKRSFSYLHLFDYNVDAIIINKVFPKKSLEGYFNEWIQLQEESIKDIKESFKGLPIFELELIDHELRKYKELIKAAEKLYKDVMPEEVLFKDKIFTVNKDDEGYYLNIHIPFATKEELGLTQKGDEITLTVKNEKRSFILPGRLKSKEIAKAKYQDDRLRIYFS
jgi:arsenite-transporting ATPase